MGSWFELQINFFINIQLFIFYKSPGYTKKEHGERPQTLTPFSGSSEAKKATESTLSKSRSSTSLHGSIYKAWTALKAGSQCCFARTRTMSAISRAPSSSKKSTINSLTSLLKFEGNQLFLWWYFFRTSKKM